MQALNQSSVTEFILLGITDDDKLQKLLFVVFSLVYTFTVLGNIGISTLIWTDRHLQTPMYFFLSNLSCIDLCYSTSITPKMLVHLISDRKSISICGCVTQLFCFTFFAASECLLLGVMAYDRYVAICYPLLYRMVINQVTCAALSCGTYAFGFLSAAVPVGLTFSLSFCRENLINHFFCDFPALFKISCSDTFTSEMVLFVFGVCVGVASNSIIITSYTYFIATILRIPSVTGRFKALSTCASHFTVVALFFGTLFFIYLQPRHSVSLTLNKWLSLFYTAVIPMLNPMIYSFRNKDVKSALRRLFNEYHRKYIFIKTILLFSHKTQKKF